MSTRRLLIAYAHPDDESFGLGALIAKYVAQGVEVSLICATNGDRGTIKPELLEGYESPAARRLAELDCASAKLGIRNVIKFGYKDSGMMGSEYCSDPECLWQAAQPELTRRVVEVIRQLKPQVVITFNRYGGYGHPDHIAIQRATTDAFTRAGDPAYAPELGEAYAPQKLYYSGIPTIALRIGILLTRLRGQDPRRLGANKDIDLQKILDNIEPAHTHVDIRDYYQAWDEASACHESQLGGRAFAFPMWVRRRFAPHQAFTRVYPAPSRDRVDEYDLFAGIHTDAPVPSAQQ